jgi:tetratricopeptide (TPR) repeat protein
MACVWLAAACQRSLPPPAALSTPCLVAVSADARGDTEIARLQGELRDRRAPAAVEQLAYRFVAQARLSNDPGEYTVAEHAARCLEELQPDDPSAALVRGHVLHQQHRFSEAEAVARHLVSTREYALDYGLLGDVLMEQGNVAEAAVAYQQMIDLKPFYQSYTRAAHLRWLKGDLPGAIELMQRAVNTASPRDPESVAWAYTRLAYYELQRGRLNEAERLVDAAIGYVPDYAAALLVRGRLLLARGAAEDAVVALGLAAKRNALPEYQWALADALRLVGLNEEAAGVERVLVDNGAALDPRTLALFLSTRQVQRDVAIGLATREIDTRRDIFTLDALAWSLASAGRIGEARPLMAQALAEGTEDPRLFVHAAAIAGIDGRKAEAARWARRAHAVRFTLLPSELEWLRKELTTTSSLPRGHS